jgi:hypothetical protein
VSSAHAVAGPLATATPIPNATASAPIRPTYCAYSMAVPPARDNRQPVTPDTHE